MSEKTAKAERKAEIIDLEERRKTMKFNIQSRFVLLGMMPAEGEYFNMRNARIVKEALALNDEEQKIFVESTFLFPGGTKTDWGLVHAKTIPKAVDVGEWLATHFRAELKKQYDAKKIRDDALDLYDMFVGTPRNK